MNRIHDSIGLPLKWTYTDVGTDPEILQKLAKTEESPTYTFLGITWDLVHNTILPNSYFNLERKKKGVQGNQEADGNGDCGLCGASIYLGINQASYQQNNSASLLKARSHASTSRHEPEDMCLKGLRNNGTQ